jgi:hypothetical protein
MARFRIAEVFTTFKNYLEKEIIALTSSDADWGGVRRDELFLFTKEKLSDGEAAPDGTCVYANSGCQRKCRMDIRKKEKNECGAC